YVDEFTCLEYAFIISRSNVITQDIATQTTKFKVLEINLFGSTTLK
ncbi:19239_t:CDS:1, partial [Racocetra persica]